MKLSQRLAHINTMVSQHYDHIWDCCCDHGLLGAALLKQQTGSIIHFVDTVPHLMASLRRKLEHFFPQQEAYQQPQAPHSWQLHCLNAKALQLAAPSQSQLIIIAGVGGDLTIQIMDTILKAHPDHPLEFILCPVHHHYKVRQMLIQHKLGLIKETLIQDNQRFYEIIHVTTQHQKPLSSVGSSMWDLSLKAHQDYLAKTLKHYQNIARGAERGKHNPIDAYQALYANVK
ncbi:tRNA (adenine(22)-N(1))-methyltransferase [Shewanella surugensis]|uniref:tRNA (Adenine(22)-N(1))-methyltransferase TrmK n=1 Tax=Shewanella surugensis TaxID=212020 RepID=A0ABT0LBE8_9GAMM|nr:tRNA (adenine(22)-N(1))-methyltransferase TrmK [Shewanella surugensis]MCL1125027.1 tRNA (adenine(22)-N(1))-methyltransferase TrmK [Shewanella surugensis]